MKYSFVLLVALLEAVGCQKSIGEICTDEKTGATGSCTLLKNCPQALEDLKKGQVPQICGFQDTQPIICCLENSGTEGPKVTKLAEQQTQKPDADLEQISRKKCREYSSFVNRKVKPELLLEPQIITKNECTFKSGTLLIGRNFVMSKEFPHMALIGYGSNSSDVKWSCGGSLISEQHILTSASCLNHRDFGVARYVLLGIITDEEIPQGQKRKIRERIAYPNPRLIDLGLLKLRRHVRVGPGIRPACLYTNSEVLATKGVTTTWGLNSVDKSSTKKQLLRLEVDFVNSDANKSSNHFHASATYRNWEGEYENYAGSVLQIYNPNVYCMYDIVGITSSTNVFSENPATYVNVAKHIRWIEEVVWPQSA